MSTHLLNELFNPAEPTIYSILVSNPDLRDVYQRNLLKTLTLLNSVVEDSKKLLSQMQAKYDEFMSLYINNPPNLLDLVVDSEQFILVTNNKIVESVSQLQKIGIDSFYGLKAEPQDVEVISDYVKDFQKRLEQMVAHRIKTPISVVQSNFYLAKQYIIKGFPISRVDEKVRPCKKQLAELKEVFDEIEFFTDVCYDVDRNNENDELLGIQTVADYIQEYVASQDIFQGINIQVECDPNDAQVRFDIIQIQKAIREILINSIDFAKKDMPLEVKIRIYVEGNRVKIVITDNGVGMTKMDKDMAFEPFYNQGMNGIHFDDLPGTGCGLGLSIAKKLVDRYGKISIESEKGHGTSVILDFLAR